MRSPGLSIIDRKVGYIILLSDKIAEMTLKVDEDHSNHVHVLYCYWDIQRRITACPWNMSWRSLKWHCSINHITGHNPWPAIRLWWCVWFTTHDMLTHCQLRSMPLLVYILRLHSWNCYFTQSLKCNLFHSIPAEMGSRTACSRPRPVVFEAKAKASCFRDQGQGQYLQGQSQDQWSWLLKKI